MTTTLPKVAVAKTHAFIGHPEATLVRVKIPCVHATIRLSTVWWQYRVYGEYEHHRVCGERTKYQSAKAWLMSVAFRQDNRSHFMGFTPVPEYEVPDHIRDALISEMMSARLRNEI